MRENGKYRIIQGCYWTMINVIFGYATFYLIDFGYSASAIGTLIAVFSIISAGLQVVLGRIADRSRRFHWKTLLLLLAGIEILGLVLLTVWPFPVGRSMVFGIVTLMLNCMISLINSACFYYEKKGIKINFGVARGIGSLTNAAGSLLMGWLTVRTGSIAVPLVGIAVMAVMFLTIMKMPYEKAEPEEAAVREKKSEGTGKERGNTNFLKKYPIFLLMVVGTALIFTVHNFIVTYMYQIVEGVGGDSSHLGVALAIAAVTEAPIMILFSRIAKKIPEQRLLVMSGIFFALKSMLMLIAGNVITLYAAQLLQPFSYGLYASAAVYFTDQCVEKEDMVTGQAFLSMSMSVGCFAGNLFGGMLIDAFGVSQMLMVGTATAAIAAVILSSAVKLNAERSIPHFKCVEH